MVVEDLDLVGVELIGGSDVPVGLVEDLAVFVEDVEDPKEPGLVCSFLLHFLEEFLDGDDVLLRVPEVLEVWDCLEDEVYQHGVGGRVGNHSTGLDVGGQGHPDIVASNPVHELDGDDALLEGWHDEPHVEHGLVELQLVADCESHLLTRDVGSLDHDG